MRFFISVLSVVAVALASPAGAQANVLDDLSIEQLMDLEVTSVSRKRERLQDAATAIHVISAADIRRSGARSIPEALRLAPGLHVAQIDANKWAISSRGFNDRYTNRLLVLMDGRHLYTPFFSGVFWDEHTLPLDNIDRIEVIRGPGAVMWGANAVHGVINIITRSARDTSGWLVQADAGSRDIGELTARLGGVTDGGWHYRVDLHETQSDLTDSVLAANVAGGAEDDWQQSRIGARIESSPADGHNIMFDMALRKGESREVVQLLDNTPLQLLTQEGDVETSGGWLSVGWEHETHEGNSTSLLAYFDQSDRENLLYDLEQSVVSVDFHQRYVLGGGHDLVWGIGGRHAQLSFAPNSMNFMALDDDEGYDLWEVFVQDEISITDGLRMIIGAKVEQSEFSDLEVQPSVRFAWRMSEQVSTWTAVSRAARTPSFGESRLRIMPSFLLPAGGPIPVPLALSIDGNEDVESEAMTAYELGGRWQIGDSLHLDVAGFYNEYEDLIGGSVGPLVCRPGDVDVTVNPFCVATASHLAQTTSITNSGDANSHGFELSFEWRPVNAWKFSGAVTHYATDYGAGDELIGVGEPDYLAHVRSEWSVSENLDLDITVRAVDEAERYAVDSFVTADARIGWRPRPELTLEIIGQNLLDDGHTEFGALLNEVVPAEIRRSVVARLTWAP